MTEEKLESLESGSPEFEVAFKSYKYLWDSLYEYLRSRRFRGECHIAISEVLQQMNCQYAEEFLVEDA